MQIIKNQCNDLNTIIFTVYINQEDYKVELEKLIQIKKKNVQINGFRKGEVPIHIIRNQYENTLTMQCIQELLNQSISNYLNKEKIDILGEILLIKQEIKDKNNMFFQFEIGLMPKFDLVINTLDLDYYNILFSDEEINKYIEKLTIYFNTIKSDKILNENDILRIEIEIISKYKKHFIKDYNFRFKELPKSIRLLLINNNKIGTCLDINSKDFFIELKHLNHAMKYKFQEHLPIKFLIKQIYHIDKNINIFDKIYGKNIIESKEDFISKIKLEVENIYNMKSNELLFNSLLSSLCQQTKIHLPKNFLQRWIQNKYSIPIEKIKEEYQQIEKEILQKLIINKLYQIYNFDDKTIQHQQPNNINNFQLEDIIKEIIKNEDNIHVISNRDFYTKISILKKKLNITNQYCSLSEFKKMLSTN